MRMRSQQRHVRQEIPVSDKALSPLRRRMVEDRTIEEHTNDRSGFVLWRSKVVVRLVTRKLSNVLFLRHVTP